MQPYRIIPVAAMTPTRAYQPILNSRRLIKGRQLVASGRHIRTNDDASNHPGSIEHDDSAAFREDTSVRGVRSKQSQSLTMAELIPRLTSLSYFKPKKAVSSQCAVVNKVGGYREEFFDVENINTLTRPLFVPTPS